MKGIMNLNFASADYSELQRREGKQKKKTNQNTNHFLNSLNWFHFGFAKVLDSNFSNSSSHSCVRLHCWAEGINPCKLAALLPLSVPRSWSAFWNKSYFMTGKAKILPFHSCFESLFLCSIPFIHALLCHCLGSCSALGQASISRDYSSSVPVKGNKCF